MMNKNTAYTVTIADTGETFECRDQENLLKAMERLQRKGIPVGCRNGGCGVCKIQVLQGDAWAKAMSRAQVSEQEESEGYLLACKAFAASDVELAVIGKMRRAVTRPKFSASEADDNNKQ